MTKMNYSHSWLVLNDRLNPLTGFNWLIFICIVTLLDDVRICAGSFEPQYVPIIVSKSSIVYIFLEK